MDNRRGGYPPYNIEKRSSDLYGITIAVAGFTEADLDIQLQDQVLTVKGQIGGVSPTEKARLKAVEQVKISNRTPASSHERLSGGSSWQTTFGSAKPIEPWPFEN